MKGFESVHLDEGEKETVQLSIPLEELKPKTGKMLFVLELAEFNVIVGSSSAGIRQEENFS